MSGNPHKIDEVQRILAPVDVEIIAVPQKIQELQTEDVHALVRDKLIKAFGSIGRPLFVDVGAAAAGTACQSTPHSHYCVPIASPHEMLGVLSQDQKIDAAVTSLLAHEAACDERATGWNDIGPKVWWPSKLSRSEPRPRHALPTEHEPAHADTAAF